MIQPGSFTDRHFIKWLDAHVHADERERTELEMRAYCKHDPRVLSVECGATWSEIRIRAENLYRGCPASDLAA